MNAETKLSPEYQVDQEQKAKLEKQHLKVQNEISKLPAAQQAVVREESRLVDLALDEMNETYFNESMFKLDEFFALHGILGGEENRKAFLSTLKKTSFGKTFTYKTKRGVKSFFRTHNDELMATDDYVYTLEASVMSTNKELASKSAKYTDIRELYCGLQSKQNYTNLGFFDRIKLAFNLVINGGLNG